MKTCIFFIVQFLFTFAHSQNLTASYSQVKIPAPDSIVPVVWYDGDDAIYIFGGGWSENRQKILRYSLSQDTIHWEGSLPLPSTIGSVHSGSNGNIFYFGADLGDNDKVLKYSPSTNSTILVAQLPHDIFGIPTLQLDSATVLILGQYPLGGRILTFNLERGETTHQGDYIHMFNGAAIKFGKNKAYLFKEDSRYMWEMDLETTTVKQISNISLPQLQQRPAVMTDGTFIFILSSFKTNPQFPDKEGILQIDPVSMTTTFIHVNNFPTANGIPFSELTGLYIPRMNRIYGFVSRGVVHSRNIEEREHREIFYIDMSPLSSQVTTETLRTEKSTTAESSWAERSTEIWTMPTQEELTTLSTVLSHGMDHKFECSSTLPGETSTCTTSEGHELDIFCESNSSQVATCHKVSTSGELHTEEEVVELIMKPSSPMDGCDFDIHGDLLDEIRSGGLDCILKNGVRFSLTFATGEIETPFIYYGVIGLIFGVTVLLVAIWSIKNYEKEKKIRRYHTVVWEADKNCEVMQ